MKARIPFTIKVLALVGASVAAWLSLLNSAGWTPSWPLALFMLWVVSPYFCFYAAAALIEKYSRLSMFPTFAAAIAVLMLVFTLIAYVGTLGDTSSTYALLFVVVPVWLYIGSFFLLLVSILLGLLLNKKRPAV